MLKVTIHDNRLVFAGDTFRCKEQIKQLGRAKWNGADKTWEITGSPLTAEQLKNVFPDLVIEVLATEDQPSMPSVEASLAGEVETGPPTDPAKNKIPANISVGQLLQSIKAVIAERLPHVIYVRGVVNKVNQYKSGSIYIDLADDEARENYLSCVVWKDSRKVLEPLISAGFKLEADLQVMFGVRVGLTPKDGRISLTVMQVVAEYTLGKIAAERDITNQRLKKEGLFDRNRQTRLPFLPQRLGILTSAQGTVIHDFLASLQMAEFGFSLYLYHVNVQGSGARQSVIQGITHLSEMANLDAILLFRGGGNPAELAVFNDYELAKAICLCPLPIISAIGHQEDQSSAQDVSFRAFGVPKDVGAFFAELVINLRRRFRDFARAIHQLGARVHELTEQKFLTIVRTVAREVFVSVGSAEQTLIECSHRLPVLGRMFVSSLKQRFLTVARPLPALGRAVVDTGVMQIKVFEEILRQVSQRIEFQDAALKSYEVLLDSVKPETQIARGFTLVKRVGESKYITSGAPLREGEEIEIQFRDITRAAKIADK